MNKKLKKVFIKPQSNIRKSMQLIKDNGLRGLIVVDKNNYLLGTLTDGDLRKFLLKKNDLNEKIDKIYNKKSKYITKSSFSKKKKFYHYLINIKFPFYPLLTKIKK